MSHPPSKNLIFEGKDSPDPPRGTNHLFVIGINDYQQVGKLNNARGDAEALVQLLQERYQFEAANITELYDEKATRREIMHQLRQRITELAPHDNLLIFFSGHGHFDSVLEEGYWVPVDADYQAIDTYVSYDFLQKIAKAAKKARHILFIVDSCYSGAVLVKSKDTNQTRLEKDPSRWIIASGRNEVVPDGKLGGNSPFAGELLELLQQHASEGIHTLRLIDRLTENVSWNSDQTPIGQPLHGVGHKGGQFVFHAKRNEKRDWQEAKESDTAAAYEGYLKAWPEATHRDEAAWSLAKTRNTKIAYRRYLDRSGGLYRLQALDRLEALEDAQRFERAKLRGEGALIRFCETYPESAFIAAAQAEITRIRAEEREPEAWRGAKEQSSVKALQNYLDQFPEGKHVDEARQQLKALETAQKRLAEEKAQQAAQEKAAQAAEIRRQEAARARQQAEAQQQAEVERKQREEEAARQKKESERKQEYEKCWAQAETDFELADYQSAQEAYAKALKLALPVNQAEVKDRLQQCRDEISFRKAFDSAQQAHEAGNTPQARKALRQALQYPSQRQAEARALLAELKVPLWQQASVRYSGLAVLVILLSWAAWTISQKADPPPPVDRNSLLFAQADSTFFLGKSQRSLEIVEQAQKLYAAIPTDWNQAQVQVKTQDARAWIMAYNDSIQRTEITEPFNGEFSLDSIDHSSNDSIEVPAIVVLNPLDELRDDGYQIGTFVDGVAIYSLGSGRQKKMGLLNQAGVLLGKTYDKVEELANGYAVYHQNGKRGYLEAKTSKVLIAARFEAAWPFEANGQAKVREEGRLIYINTKGECVRDCQQDASELITNETKTTQPTVTTNPKEIPIPEMVWVKGGEFSMGSNDQSDEKPIHRVTLSNFSIGKYEVTQREWKAVMGDNPSRFKCDNCPVENVSWKDAQQYIRKLNQLTTENFRLPTEAEWEYAARGGQKSKSTTYAGSSSLGAVGWFDDNSGNKTHPVGQKRGNELGLYDMSGNVYEWCADWYGSDYYASSPTNNPKGPNSGVLRVLRGGSWYRVASGCRVANRYYSSPDYWSNFVGLRLARSY